MKKKNTIFDFLGQVFLVFGVTIAILLVLCFIVSDNAKEMSSMFRLGSSGLSAPTLIQFFAVSILITGAKFFYFNDHIFKKASITTRTSLMLLTDISITAAFIYLFEWFPIDMWMPWLMFLICFGTCFLVSVLVTFTSIINYPNILLKTTLP